MRIKNIKFWSVEMKLTEPYTISYETISETTNVFIMLETNTGIVAYGCTAPDKEITGETASEVLQKLEQVAQPILNNADPLRMAWILHKLKMALPDSPSLLAGVDMALYDLLAKIANLPLYQMLGGFRKHIKTSITIGILPVEETLAKAQEFIKKGFKCIKVKGGADVDLDIERMIKIRETVGKKVELRFDANQGYTLEECLHFVKSTRQVKIELIEQPTPKNKFELLGRVTNQVAIPIMADESLLNLSDAFRLAKKDLVNMVNIKLMKVGGIRQAISINAIAQAAQIESMVGCMDEVELGIAAGMHFALSQHNVLYADLDSHFDIIGDPSRGVIIRDGVLYPQNKPGLGCELDF